MRKVLVCGSRSWADPRPIEQAIGELPDDAVIIQGKCRGADLLARACACARGLWVIDVPVEDIHWRRYGGSAGHRRNGVMVELQPDLVIAFQARPGHGGTQGTINAARRHGIPTIEHRPGGIVVPPREQAPLGSQQQIAFDAAVPLPAVLPTRPAPGQAA